VAKGENDFVLPADMVIAAIGQKLVPSSLFDGVAPRQNEREYISADPVTGRTSVDWVFAGGDAVSGPSSVVEAIAAGERAAAGIDKYLTGESHATWRSYTIADTFFDPDADPILGDRPEVRLISVAKRMDGFTEVETTLPCKAALAESKRCLRCDYREERAKERAEQHAAVHAAVQTAASK
jgi:NADH-quinone oxidoreductase subunit F